MKKIPSLFQRNYDTDHLVRDEIVPGCEWVVAGEGIATRKWDGLCVMIRDGKLYKRYELKPNKTAPQDWEPADERDEVTGRQTGWIPVKEVNSSLEDRYMLEGMVKYGTSRKNGTYEFIGPKSQGNAENFPYHWLILHGNSVTMGSTGDCSLRDGPVPRTFEGLKTYLAEEDVEGIVWHHPDGRMVKIKGKDFGIKRPRFISGE